LFKICALYSESDYAMLAIVAHFWYNSYVLYLTCDFEFSYPYRICNRIAAWNWNDRLLLNIDGEFGLSK